MTSIVCFGECMIELSRLADGSARVAYGGDTLNTAVYLARLGQLVTYMTALGNDPWSAEMLAGWASEGIDLSCVLRHPDRLPGLYAITTQPDGERSFGYWRDQSAARAFFAIEGADAVLDRALQADLLYLSGITLALFASDSLDRVLGLAREIRARGGGLAFDPNYRARLWPSPERARSVFEAIAPFVTVALPSFEDELALWGDATCETTWERWSGHGVGEVVVKHGRAGALTSQGWVTGPVVARPIDTTGAGDSFNAGYLASRRRGHDPDRAAALGARLAAEVIRHRGAVIPKRSMPSW